MDAERTGEEDGRAWWRLKEFVRPGVVGSLFLHAAVLAFLLYQVGAPPPPVSVIPVEMVQLAEETATTTPQPAAAAAPAAPRVASVAPPRASVQPPRIAPVPAPTAPPSAEQPASNALPPVPVDPLQRQLEELAKLRLPSSGTATPSGSNLPAGAQAGYRVEDLIRAQVLRRWNLRLDELGESELTIRIHVVLEADGTVAKAEIIDLPDRTMDGVRRSIALSARNAVLLSSPLTLPAGLTAEMRDMTLSLNTRDTLR
jgi:hypothetical protein